MTNQKSKHLTKPRTYDFIPTYNCIAVQQNFQPKEEREIHRRLDFLSHAGTKLRKQIS